LYFAMPHFQPELFQRIAMAKNSGQAKRALNYSAGILSLIFLVSVWVGILLLADNPDLAKKEVVTYMVKKYTYPGMAGFLGAGIIALAMSTADSSLNSISVMFANDLVKPWTSKAYYGSVTIARLFSVVVGLFALFLALFNQDLLKLVLLSVSLYMPIFTIPMLMAVLGFRTSAKSVLISMAAGLLTVILWSVYFTNANSVIPGMLANLIMLLGSHYLLGEPGGWQPVSPDSPLGLARAARKEAWQRRLRSIKGFRLYPYLQQILPQQEGVYTIFGFYAIAATYIGLYTIGPADVEAYKDLYEGIYHTVLVAITVFITFPIWPSVVKSKRFITFFWPLGMAATLFFTGMLLVILSRLWSVALA
ncbi:MAG: metal-dependent phosphohydrolase, partial [Bacteroidota bacterium]